MNNTDKLCIQEDLLFIQDYLLSMIDDIPEMKQKANGRIEGIRRRLDDIRIRVEVEEKA